MSPELLARLLLSGVDTKQLRALAATADDEYLESPSTESSPQELPNDITPLALSSPLYPRYFAVLSSPPPVILVKGNLQALAPGLGFVGTRDSSRIAQSVAQAAGAACAKLSIPLHSGGAQGTDTAGHLAAIEHGALTTLWLPCSFDSMPPAYEKLSAQILEANGAVVSTFPQRSQPAPSTLHGRNAWIVAASSCVLVGEGNLQSKGTLSAVRLTLTSRKPLLVPGLKGVWKTQPGAGLANYLSSLQTGKELGLSSTTSINLGFPRVGATVVESGALPALLSDLTSNQKA